MSDQIDPEKIFEIQERIGEGWVLGLGLESRSYGSVFKAVHVNTNRVVAIKIIPVESNMSALMQEIKILKSCKSDFIVSYYGSYYKEGDLWVLLLHVRLTLDRDGIRRLRIASRFSEQRERSLQRERNPVPAGLHPAWNRLSACTQEDPSSRSDTGA